MEVPELLRMTPNWKAPGRDQIANFRLKQHIHIQQPFLTD
jgi:hypothetical protein